MTTRRASINPNLFRGPSEATDAMETVPESVDALEAQTPVGEPEGPPRATADRRPASPRQARPGSEALLEPGEAPKLEAEDAHPVVTPTDQLANLTMRVRRPLDDRLADLEHALTRQLRDLGDTPTSKTELVELLLWELPPMPTDDLRARLHVFRARAGRR